MSSLVGSLDQPLLVNGDRSGVQTVATVLTNDCGHGHGIGSADEKLEDSTEDKYRVDVDQPEALEPADLSVTAAPSVISCTRTAGSFC